MNLGPAEIGLMLLAVMLLFGYTRLPDAARSFGRSLRILKSEVDDLHDDSARPTPASSKKVVVPVTSNQSAPDSHV